MPIHDCTYFSTGLKTPSQSRNHYSASPPARDPSFRARYHHPDSLRARVRSFVARYCYPDSLPARDLGFWARYHYSESPRVHPPTPLDMISAGLSEHLPCHSVHFLVILSDSEESKAINPFVPYSLNRSMLPSFHVSILSTVSHVRLPVQHLKTTHNKQAYDNDTLQ